MWLSQVVDKTRKDRKAELALNCLKSIAVKCTGLAHKHGGIDIDTGSNLQCWIATICSELALHSLVARSWKLQWDSMAPLLTTDWQSEQLPLLDVITFLTSAGKSRRKQGKKAWDRQRSGIELAKVRGIFTGFLRNVLLGGFTCCGLTHHPTINRYPQDG